MLSDDIDDWTGTLTMVWCGLGSRDRNFQLAQSEIIEMLYLSGRGVAPKRHGPSTGMLWSHVLILIDLGLHW